MTSGADEGEKRSFWRRALRWLKIWDEAVSFSYDEHQDHRIDALQKQITELKLMVAGSSDAAISAKYAAGHDARPESKVRG